MTTSRTTDRCDAGIHASWYGTDFSPTSPTWRLMHADEAAACGDLVGDEPGLDARGTLCDGWPQDAAALLASAWWVAEAIWRNGVAAPTLNVGQLRRARQIGLASLATTPAGPPPSPATAAWLASSLFDDRSRAVVRLQLARPPADTGKAAADLVRRIAPAQAARLVGFARSAMESP